MATESPDQRRRDLDAFYGCHDKGDLAKETPLQAWIRRETHLKYERQARNNDAQVKTLIATIGQVPEQKLEDQLAYLDYLHARRDWIYQRRGMHVVRTNAPIRAQL